MARMVAQGKFERGEGKRAEWPGKCRTYVASASLLALEMIAGNAFHVFNGGAVIYIHPPPFLSHAQDVMLL